MPPLGLLHHEASPQATVITRRRNRLASTSLTYNQAMELMEDTQPLSRSTLICRRIVILLIMLLILGIGVFLQFKYRLEDPFAIKPVTCIPADEVDPFSNATISLPICTEVMTTVAPFETTL